MSGSRCFNLCNSGGRPFSTPIFTYSSNSTHMWTYRTSRWDRLSSKLARCFTSCASTHSSVRELPNRLMKCRASTILLLSVLSNVCNFILFKSGRLKRAPSIFRSQSPISRSSTTIRNILQLTIDKEQYLINERIK